MTREGRRDERSYRDDTIEEIEFRLSIRISILDVNFDEIIRDYSLHAKAVYI